MALAPAAHCRGVAGRTVPAARPGAAPTAPATAVADEWQRRRWTELRGVVELVEGCATHETPFAGSVRMVLSHTLTYPDGKSRDRKHPRYGVEKRWFSTPNTGSVAAGEEVERHADL